MHRSSSTPPRTDICDLDFRSQARRLIYIFHERMFLHIFFYTPILEKGLNGHKQAGGAQLLVSGPPSLPREVRFVWLFIIFVIYSLIVSILLRGSEIMLNR